MLHIVTRPSGNVMSTWSRTRLHLQSVLVCYVLSYDHVIQRNDEEEEETEEEEEEEEEEEKEE